MSNTFMALFTTLRFPAVRLIRKYSKSCTPANMDNKEKIEFIKKHIKAFPDYPEPGINFRDVFTAFTNGQVCTYVKDLLVDHVQQNCANVEAIVGLESRGFLFNFLLASELGLSCVPIRKKGKLPGKVVSVEYMKEYGPDIFEMQIDAIKPGQKVIIVDDLIATGGSLKAAIELVRKAGGVVLEALVIIELKGLNARKILDCDVHSLIQYE